MAAALTGPSATDYDKHGIAATGTVGDEDPLLAIENALHQFAADEVAVFTTDTTDAANENWREQRLIEKAPALRLPLSWIRVNFTR
jgi:hypothetical protein